MAKSSAAAKTQAAPEAEQKAVAVQETRPGGPPAHLAARLAASEGRGVSTAREDNVVPLLYVLQKGSPQTDERGDAYVRGAKAGELWVRGSEGVISGTTGVVVQPCAFLRCWIEWGPKRGDGFKARHADRPDAAEEKETRDDQGRPQMQWVMPSGNIVVETREHYVLVGHDALVIPFTSTGHTVSREWMALMNRFRDERGRPLDSFARQYRLTTVRKEKDGNTWYVIKAVDAGWVGSAEQYDLGLALHQAVMAGEKVAEAPSEDDRAPDKGRGDGGDEAEREANARHAESVGI